MNDLIMKETYIVGCVKDVISYFKNESIKLLEEMDILNPDSDSSDVEDTQREINYNLNLVNSIYQDLILEAVDENTLITVLFENCKGYEYKILIEKEKR